MHKESEEAAQNGILSQQDSRATIQDTSEHAHHTSLDQQYSRPFQQISEILPPPYETAVYKSSSNSVQLEQPKPIDEDVLQSRPPVSFHPDYRWPRFSTNAVCPVCGATGHTRAETESTLLTYVIAVILFALCCCLSIIPFCFPSCKKTTHYCSNCNAVLSEVEPFQ
ncbi:unnamed protein product [Adineta ricciae]|uniref:LITAF domain-containing protein n=1 Tax=Adineta ricciae TaxID=249248 RepID=A0A815QYR7_ADIRI|nr:unnamed protein product [Adineta ricciae]